MKTKYKGYTLKNTGTPSMPVYCVFNRNDELIEHCWFPSEFKYIVDCIVS